MVQPFDRAGFRRFGPDAVANALRGVDTDAACLNSVLQTINGPIVLAGHSYGGVIITNAATGNPTPRHSSTSSPSPPTPAKTSAACKRSFPGSKLTKAALDIRPRPNARWQDQLRWQEPRRPSTRAPGHPARRRRALRQDHRVLADLAAGHADGTWGRRLRELAKPAVLILDDFGMRELTAFQADDLYKLTSERAGDH